MTKEYPLDEYVLDHQVNEQREDFLTAQLQAFNQTHTTAHPVEPHEALPLHLYALDQTGTIRGGVVGRTHAIPQWLEISLIATSNFQAPGFYEHLGYALYGRLENCPPGETVLYFWKELTASQL